MTTWHSFDGGFGNTKAIVNGKEIIYPHLIGNYNPGSDGLSDDETPLSIRVDGVGEWNFGYTALHQSTSPHRPQDNNRIFKPEFLANLLLAISEGYSPNTDTIECNIITGFPGSDFNRLENNPTLKSQFRKNIIGEHKIQRPGYRQKITIKDIRYTRQGYGAIWKQLIDEHGRQVKLNVGNANTIKVGCINVGFNTLEGDEVIVSRLNHPNKPPHPTPVDGRQLSEAKGVYTIVDRLVENLTSRFNQTFDREKALEILEANGLMLNGQWQEYHLPNSIKSELADTVYSAVTNVWQSGTSFLYRLILTGGGANIVSDRFANMPQVVVSKRPQFDTVQGYLRLAKNVFRGK